MDLVTQNNNVASYPSRLVNLLEPGSLRAVNASLNVEKDHTHKEKDLQKHALESSKQDRSESPEQKRQRTDLNDKARERAQRQLIEAINRKTQEKHGPNSRVFPNQFLDSNKAADATPYQPDSSRHQPGQKSSVEFPVATSNSNFHIASLPDGTQQQQTVTPAPASTPFQLPFPQAQHYYDLPVPGSYPSTVDYSLHSSGYKQSNQNNQQRALETSIAQSNQHAQPKAQHTAVLPARTPSQSRPTTLPASDSSTLCGVSEPQQINQQRQDNSFTSSERNTAYLYGPYPPYPEPLPASLGSGFTEGAPIPKTKAKVRVIQTPRKSTIQPTNQDSSAPLVNSSSPCTPYRDVQSTPGEYIPAVTSDLTQSFHTPQESLLQEGWGPLGTPTLTPPKHSGKSNGLPDAANTVLTTSASVGQLSASSPLDFETSEQMRGVLKTMDYRVITQGANNALAAHESATPLAFRSPYPPPQNSEDIRYAAGRVAPNWNQAKTIYLKIDPTTRPNDYIPYHAETQAIQALIFFPIDWDLAFYHSEKLAWYYCTNNRQLPTTPYPIKISFPLTGYVLTNWFFNQAIYPLPLLLQEPLFPQQGIPDEQTLLVDLYICATDLQIPKLQNLALNELDRVRNVTVEMSLTALCHTYNHTAEGSPLRKYLIWQYANRLRESVIMEARAKAYYPAEFLQEWVVMLTQMWKSLNGRNDRKVDLNLEDFMVQEKKVAWPYAKPKVNGA